MSSPRLALAVVAVVGLCLVPPAAQAASHTTTTSTGCQFLTHPGDTAAFCDDFTEGPRQGGRAAQLNPAAWDVTRTGGPDGGGDMFPWPDTPVGACQSGVSKATADHDILVCDSASGHGGQIETAIDAQNYAIMSMRPRQPFDFAGRTGTITFNVDAYTLGGLAWWPSVFVTDEPYATADDSMQVLGLLPRNGIGVDLWAGGQCGGAPGSKGSVAQVNVYRDYAETDMVSKATVNDCYRTARGQLNHFELRLSKTEVELWASDDGTRFPNFREVFAAPVHLDFTRGYVYFDTSERAPAKYHYIFGIKPTYANYYWSELGFDGPVVTTGETGYMVPDALITDPNDGAPNVAYAINNHPRSICCRRSGATFNSFSFSGVKLTGVTSAALAFDAAYTYCCGIAPTHIGLQWSLNGSPFAGPDPKPDAPAETVCGSCPGAPGGGGGVAYYFPVPIRDLRKGTNNLRIQIPYSCNCYPPLLTGLDLLTFPAGIAPLSSTRSTDWRSMAPPGHDTD